MLELLLRLLKRQSVSWTTDDLTTTTKWTVWVAQQSNLQTSKLPRRKTIPMSRLKPSQLKKKMPSTLIKNSSPDLLALTATSIGGMYSTGPNIIQRSPGERWYFSERINITNQHSTVIIWGFLENIHWTTSRWFERDYHHHDLKGVIIIVISPLPIKWCTGHWLASFL